MGWLEVVFTFLNCNNPKIFPLFKAQENYRELLSHLYITLISEMSTSNIAIQKIRVLKQLN